MFSAIFHVIEINQNTQNSHFGQTLRLKRKQTIWPVGNSKPSCKSFYFRYAGNSAWFEINVELKVIWAREELAVFSWRSVCFCPFSLSVTSRHPNVSSVAKQKVFYNSTGSLKSGFPVFSRKLFYVCAHPELMATNSNTLPHLHCVFASVGMFDRYCRFSV